MGYAHVGNYDYRSILVLRQDRVLLGPGSVPLKASVRVPPQARRKKAETSLNTIGMVTKDTIE